MKIYLLRSYLIILFIFLANSVFSQDFPFNFNWNEICSEKCQECYICYGSITYSNTETGKSFKFHKDNRITGYKNGNLNASLHTGSYIINIEHRITFLLITWDDNTSDRYLILYSSSFICLYNSNSFPFFEGETWFYIPSRFRAIETRILSATSQLREGNILYSTDNLDLRIGACWVEGVPGQGIGEKIIFSHQEPNNIHFNLLRISIGFVSYTRPHLYEANSRPKKLRISLEGESPLIIDLLDTPNFQSLGGIWWSGDSEKDLWIEILEVYPGSRFEDTCINALVRGFTQ